MGETFDAVIVGAGHNGLTAAAYLARAGKKVLVLERRPEVGGTAATLEFAPGYRASVGDDLCGMLLPRVMEELELGRHGLELVDLEASVFAPAPDGKALTLWRDRERTLGEIRRHSTADAQAYPRFAELVEGLSGFLRPFLSRPAPEPEIRSAADLLDFLKLGWGFRQLGARQMQQAFRVLPMAVSDFLNEWLETDLLKGLLAAPGVKGICLGPYSAGTAAVFLYHQLGAPGWPRTSYKLPRGGMGSVTQALARTAEKHGARIRTRAPVSRVSITDGRAHGVVLEGGEEISAHHVLSNADPGTTLLTLADPAWLEPRYLNDLRNIRYRGVVAKVLLALGELPNFESLPAADASPHHRGVIHMGPDLGYLERAYDDAKYGRPSAEPFLEATIPSLADPSMAPPGKHVLSVTVQYAPYHRREGSWSEGKDALADTVVETLARYAPNVRNAVLHRAVITPVDYEREYGAPEGSLHHGELALDQLFFMRPVPGAGYRTPIDRLYLCGSGTHPGGGVTAACGYNAAQQVLKDRRTNG